MTSLTKNSQPPTKKFFLSADQKTCRILWGFEELSSAISRGAMALVRQRRKLLVLGRFPGVIYS